ncbi:MAG TPA: class I SAM-dependent methyltransferase [Nocardioides sp.]|uniref:class I SAM-dependent methyltransferase n=1 Tax=Nocardioides sp. TaxID=35761 RepID=UPI002D7ED1F4|nr:class I SAM-dependent methyltransferase [Nocardioides sp.]HET6651466.1 class I SAM-dependent methyltransferase [Nocardioides sp.]
MAKPLDGAVPSPNIWHHPQTYEVENRAVDPEGAIDAAMRSVASWQGRDFLDLGCGTGFHLPRWAADARSVVGVEPHPDLAAVAVRRTARHPNASVRVGTAQRIPLPDACVDVAQARWAYFFGPGCEPGLADLGRVMRRGGTAFIVDNDARRSTFGGWFRRGYPNVDPEEVERFWSRHGWQRIGVDTVWRFESRADLEAVVRIELPGDVAEAVLREHGVADGLEVDYAVNVWWRRY